MKKRYLASLGLTLLITFAACNKLDRMLGKEDSRHNSVNVPAPASASEPVVGLPPFFSVLGAETVTNTGPTIVAGNVGVSPGSAITGFPPGEVTDGALHVTDAPAINAKAQTLTAYNALSSRDCTMDLTGTDLGGLTLKPGVYCFSSSALLTGALTLDGEGNSNAQFIFKTGSTLTTASNSSVVMENSASDCQVYWKIGSSATLGTGSQFVGNILALTSITLMTNASVMGKVLALNGAVTMDSNRVTPGSCTGCY